MNISDVIHDNLPDRRQPGRAFRSDRPAAIHQGDSRNLPRHMNFLRQNITSPPGPQQTFSQGYLVLCIVYLLLIILSLASADYNSAWPPILYSYLAHRWCSSTPSRRSLCCSRAGSTRAAPGVAAARGWPGPGKGLGCGGCPGSAPTSAHSSALIAAGVVG